MNDTRDQAERNSTDMEAIGRVFSPALGEYSEADRQRHRARWPDGEFDRNLGHVVRRGVAYCGTYSEEQSFIFPKPHPIAVPSSSPSTTYNLAINGTVTIATSGSGSSFAADVNDTFTETQLSTTCPGTRRNGGTLSGGAADYKGSSDTISIKTSQSVSGTSRTHDFTGALKGNTITGTVTKTFSSRDTPPPGSGAPAGTIVTATHGPSNAMVILQKR